MEKLSKEQYDRLQKLLKVCENARDDLENVIDDFNRDMRTKYDDEVLPAVKDFNEARESLQAYVEELKQEAIDHFDDQSDNWQASDEGENYQAWIDQMEMAYEDLDNEFEADSFTELETPDGIDLSSTENIGEEP